MNAAVLQPLHAVTRPPTVDELVALWIEAKRDEDVANKHRVELEAAIVKLVGEPDEGSETHELADGSKLTVTGKITRTIDEETWRRVMSGVPENLRPITFVEKAVLDLKGLRWLMEREPSVYAVVATAITAKRAKTAISVKV